MRLGVLRSTGGPGHTARRLSRGAAGHAAGGSRVSHGATLHGARWSSCLIGGWCSTDLAWVLADYAVDEGGEPSERAANEGVASA
jgi:hypothetical protein